MKKIGFLIKIVLTLAMFAVAAIGIKYYMNRQAVDNEQTSVQPENEDHNDKKATPPPRPLIDYNKLETDPYMRNLTNERKAKYGLDKGIDLIVKPDEKVKIGEKTISMKAIIEKSKQARGEIIEKNLEGTPSTQELIDSVEYGLHIVKPGDNIWNIHFQLLQEYFSHRNIQLSPAADEPDQKGQSSGVGKLLKFSEKMVYIYNLMDHRIDSKINLIEPLSKIVVYRMNDVFALLDQITYKDVNRIEFDGETLWIPASERKKRN